MRQTQQGTAFEDAERTNEGSYLPKVAHVDQCPADRAISKMIGLGFGNAGRIEAGKRDPALGYHFERLKDALAFSQPQLRRDNVRHLARA